MTSTPLLQISFAPIQGYTEAVYRNLHDKIFGGIDCYYTPFVRYEKGGIRNKDLRETNSNHNQVDHLIPQLLANTKEKAETILSYLIEQGYKEVNINLGCPFPLLANKHNGSGILPYPEEAEQLLTIVDEHPDIKFSVKMRLGWESANECMQIAPLLNKHQLSHVIMHPRIGKQQYKGEVNLEQFKAFLSSCHHPVIYNGDIHTIEDIYHIQEQCPELTGIMIGRGLLANPALAWEYKNHQKMDTDIMKSKLLSMHQQMLNEYEQQLEGGELQILTKIKPFWEYLEPQIGHKAWKAIKKSSTLPKYYAAIRL